MTYYVAGLPYSANDIYHHGIKGQRWGIRRFQNPDGSLTPEGQRRYGTVENFEATRNKNELKKRQGNSKKNDISKKVKLKDNQNIYAEKGKRLNDQGYSPAIATTKTILHNQGNRILTDIASSVLTNSGHKFAAGIINIGGMVERSSNIYRTMSNNSAYNYYRYSDYGH